MNGVLGFGPNAYRAGSDHAASTSNQPAFERSAKRIFNNLSQATRNGDRTPDDVTDLYLQDRRDQKLGIFVLRIIQDLVGQPRLHDLPGFHHHQPVREQPHHG